MSGKGTKGMFNTPQFTSNATRHYHYAVALSQSVADWLSHAAHEYSFIV